MPRATVYRLTEDAYCEQCGYTLTRGELAFYEPESDSLVCSRTCANLAYTQAREDARRAERRAVLAHNARELAVYQARRAA
jgi:hypothetical protein